MRVSDALKNDDGSIKRNDGAVLRFIDGPEVSIDDGMQDRKAVIDTLGVRVGDAPGNKVGKVGTVLGMSVGASDGALLSRIVGRVLGTVIGMDVGASDGALLGRIVGKMLGTLLGINAGASD